MVHEMDLGMDYSFGKHILSMQWVHGMSDEMGRGYLCGRRSARHIRHIGLCSVIGE